MPDTEVPDKPGGIAFPHPDPSPSPMRFPFSLTSSMTSYLLRKKLSGEKIFPLVLMLEPLHACNLHCSGCGRIREYAGIDEPPAERRSMPGGRQRVRIADRQHLRRRTAHLSGNRRTGRKTPRSGKSTSTSAPTG